MKTGTPRAYLTQKCGISVEQLMRAAVRDAIALFIDAVIDLPQAVAAAGMSGVAIVSSDELCSCVTDAAEAACHVIALYDPEEGLDSESAGAAGVHAWVPLDDNAPHRICSIILRIDEQSASTCQPLPVSPDAIKVSQQLDLILRKGSVGVWDLEALTRRLVLSDAWLGRLGQGPASIGLPLSDFHELVHPDDLSRVVDVHDAHLAGNVPEYECEYRIRAGDGEWRWILDTGRVITADAFGHPVRSAGAHIDITDRMRAGDAQRLAAIGQVAAGVAHELNNMLAGMLMQAEVASQSQSSGDRQRLVELVLGTARHAGELCQSLTAFARTRAPSQKYVLLDEVIEEAFRIARRQVENCGITVHRAYRAGQAHVYADAGQLQQVFLNLIINACHAMPAGGTLTLATTHRRSPGGFGDVVGSVGDTGAGIAPEHVDRIFDTFFTTKPMLGEGDVAGTGLGLSVSRSLVTANRGRIEVSTGPGAGATFEVCLPCAGEPPIIDCSEVAGVDALPRPRGLRILVAEDEDALRSLIREGVGSIADEVIAVGTTTEAIAQLDSRRFDVVISDLMMPGGGGYALLDHVRRIEKPPPVLLVTGLVGDHIAEHLARRGAAACLLKPFSVRALLDAVNEITADSGVERSGEGVA